MLRSLQNESKRFNQRIIFFDDEDDVLAYLYDEDSDVEYECDFKVDYDVVPYLNLEEIKRY